MSVIIRSRDWWLGQFRKTSGLGKVAWVGVPLLLSCCFCSLALMVIVPSPDVEPTAELAERAAATVEVEATEELVELTAEAIDEPATGTSPTTTPSRTLAPTRTAAPTETEERATARPSATPRPATPTTAPSATPVPPTATRPPATATAVPPTAVLPTATRPLATAVPPTAVLPTAVPPTPLPPTAVPQPTATLPPAATSGDVIISSVRYDGDVPQVESDEYAVITNRGGVVINLSGWRLNAGEPDQNFTFPSFDLQPGQSCRVYTNEFHPESCGFSFGRGDAIWRNSGDCGTLHDAAGAEVSRYCWN